VAGIVVQAQAARLVAAKRPETLDGMLTGIESAGNDALAAMRRVVSLLRDPGDAAGLAPGPEQLSDLAGRFAGHGPAVRLRLPDADQPPWPPEVAAAVYRIVQEALTNVALHARDAATVAIVVDGDQSGVRVEVTDDGQARPPAPAWFAAGGHGLVGMRERVEALGGTLHAGPGPGGGWAVRAAVPLPARSMP
jgi:signal transduction histidine kinase